MGCQPVRPDRVGSLFQWADALQEPPGLERTSPGQDHARAIKARLGVAGLVTPCPAMDRRSQPRRAQVGRQPPCQQPLLRPAPVLQLSKCACQLERAKTKPFFMERADPSELFRCNRRRALLLGHQHGPLARKALACFGPETHARARRLVTRRRHPRTPRLDTRTGFGFHLGRVC